MAIFFCTQSPKTVIETSYACTWECWTWRPQTFVYKESSFASGHLDVCCWGQCACSFIVSQWNCDGEGDSGGKISHKQVRIVRKTNLKKKIKNSKLQERNPIMRSYISKFFLILRKSNQFNKDTQILTLKFTLFSQEKSQVIICCCSPSYINRKYCMKSYLADNKTILLYTFFHLCIYPCFYW